MEGRPEQAPGTGLRVEELAARAGVAVDTIRYYQARGLLPPPVRRGRVALYGGEHAERLARIRRLQERGLSLAVIHRLLTGELDRADEELAAAVEEAADEAPGGGAEEWLTLAELAERSAIPLPLLQAVEREGLLVPRNHEGELRYTADDARVATAGLRMLEHGLPLPELLSLARQHHAAVRAVAEQAVDLFDAHVRRPLRQAGVPAGEAAARLVEAFEALLPATETVVAHHFRRTLLAVAQEHIERVGNDAERRAVAERAAQPLASPWS
jgi:DNA-binding transcriptional MerR regulator